jgi:membrane protein DedA with SNARE-associated domain
MVSALIWNGLLLFAGMMVGKNWEIISDIIAQYNIVLIALTVIVIGYFIYRRSIKRKSEEKSES